MSSNDTSSTFSTIDIVGVVIGGVLGLATVIGIIISVYTMCCRKNNQSQIGTEHISSPSNNASDQPMKTDYHPKQSPYRRLQETSWD